MQPLLSLGILDQHQYCAHQLYNLPFLWPYPRETWHVTEGTFYYKGITITLKGWHCSRTVKSYIR